jgi:hypothetical protein
MSSAELHAWIQSNRRFSEMLFYAPYERFIEWARDEWPWEWLAIRRVWGLV